MLWLHSTLLKDDNCIEVADLAGVTIRGETGSRSMGPTQGRDIPTPEEIRGQLSTILASPAFHGSKRCQQFLEYVCEKWFAGEAGALKERTVAIDVFGRQPQSELGEDTIVRVGAREVRKRLAQFYVSPEGVASRIRIDLPAGSYAPEFHYATALIEKPPPPPVPAPIVVAPPARRRMVIATSSLAFLVLAGGALRLTGLVHRPDVLTKFWKPVLDSGEPLLVGVAHPLVYQLSIRAQKLSESRLPPSEIPEQRPVQLPARLLDGSDIIAVPDHYVAFGDMVAADQVTAMLARRSKGVRLRFADAISFADLRQTPALLIGALTNHWTMEFQSHSNWRYQFQFTPDSSVLVDTFDKPAPGVAQRQWSVASVDDATPSEDYVLICRLKNASTAGFVVVVAGLKQFGTEAAGRLVTDADQLAVVTRDLQPGWENKNLQVVLRVRVIGKTPAQPDVVASYVW
jgi:hypothetical protein